MKIITPGGYISHGPWVVNCVARVSMFPHDGTGRGRVLPLADRERQTASLKLDPDPAEEPEQDRERDRLGPEVGEDEQEQEQAGDIRESVDDPLDDVVPPAPKITRGDPEADANDHRHERSEHPDRQRDPGAVHEPHDLAATEVVG